MNAIFIIAVFVIALVLILIFTLTGAATEVQPEVFVTGYYKGETSFNDYGNGSRTGATLPAGTNNVSFLSKYTDSGSVEWAARQEGGGSDIGYGVATDRQNNVFMTGKNGPTGVSFYNQGNNDDAIFTLPSGTNDGSFLAKYSNSGNVAWAARQDGGGSDIGRDVAIDSQNNVFMTGANGTSGGMSFYSQGNNDVPSVTLQGLSVNGSFLAKYSNSGSVEWAARQEGGGVDISYGVDTDRQNNVFMTGKNGPTGVSFYSQESNVASVTLPAGSGSGSFLAKYSNNGSVTWAARQDGAGGTDIGHGVATDSQNNVFMTGQNVNAGISFYSREGSGGPTVTLPSGPNIGSFLAKYSNSGNVAWAARQSGGGNDYGYGVATDRQNNVYMAGQNDVQGISFYSQESNVASVTIPAGSGTGIASFLAKYSNNGSVEWAARQDGGGTDKVKDVATDSQNNVYITGDFYGSGGISFYNQGYPNTPVFTLEKLGASDDSTFTSKYNSKGEFQWAAVIGSSVAGEANSGYSIAAT